MPGFSGRLADLRLPDRDAWTRVRRDGRRARLGELELRWVAPSPDGCTRLGVLLRRKNGPAPLRNRVRRQLRELIRLERPSLEPVWMVWSLPPIRIKSSTTLLRTQAVTLVSNLR